MRRTQLVMVALVLLILVLAYFAFVGESKPNKDVPEGRPSWSG